MALIFFFNKVCLFICMSVCPACTCTICMHSWCPWRPEEASDPLNLASGGCELPRDDSKPRLGPLQEQRTLSSTEPLLQSCGYLCSIFICTCPVWCCIQSARSGFPLVGRDQHCTTCHHRRGCWLLRLPVGRSPAELNRKQLLEQ